MKNKKKLLIIIPSVICAAVIVAYLAGVVYYKSHFFKGTSVYGTDVSKLQVDDFKDGLSDYKLTVVEKDTDGNTFTEEIAADDMGLSVSSTAELSDIMSEQNYWTWPLGQGAAYCESGTLISYDDDKVRSAVQKLTDSNEDYVVPATNASISAYTSGSGYEIVPETEGNELDEEATVKAIESALSTMETEIDLSDEGCYTKPDVTSDDEELNTLLDTMNKYVGVTVTYQFGDNEEKLDGDTISQWIYVKNGKVKFKDSEIAEYVDTLRSKYDTIFTTRKFKTSYGKKVTIVGGDYGWWMNTSQEAKDLKKVIKQGKSVDRTPDYYQTADNYGKTDYGDTYVEVNLTAQHIIYYKNGKKLLESDCVTGNSSKGYDTPEGVYSITYKQKDATLQGQGYASPVSYWMPFNRNIGLHDATWRSSFGGSIYKTSGSHGCVNLPYSAAQKLYKYIEAGTAVICYNMP